MDVLGFTHRIKQLLLILLLFYVWILSARQMEEKYWGDYTPIRTKTDFTKDVLQYKKGDLETIRIRIYLNKADTLYYEPGRSYLLSFCPLWKKGSSDKLWEVLSSSITQQENLLDDDNPVYEGVIKLRCKADESFLNFWVSTFRIAVNECNEFNYKYDYIDASQQYRADQHQLIVFRNLKAWQLIDYELRYIDRN